MKLRKDLTVGEVTKEQLRIWMQQIVREKRLNNRERQKEIKNRIELLRNKTNYHGTRLRRI